MNYKTTFFFPFLIFVDLDKISSADTGKTHITKKSNKAKKRGRYTN